MKRFGQRDQESSIARSSSVFEALRFSVICTVLPSKTLDHSMSGNVYGVLHVTKIIKCHFETIFN